MGAAGVPAGFSSLARKYRNFRAPTVRITVDGVELITKETAKIKDVSVELGISSTASGCSFDIIGEYAQNQSSFQEGGSYEKLQIGAAIEVALGYIETETVFVGLIAELEYIFDEDSMPIIHVECADAKLVLMKQQKLKTIQEQSIPASIAELFDEQPFTEYISGKEVASGGNDHKMIPIPGESDFQFVARWAEYYGYEFFILQGKVFLRKAPNGGTSLFTFEKGKGIVKSLRLSLKSGGLFTNAEVVAINPTDDKVITGKTKIEGKFSAGNGAKKMLGATTKRFFDYTAVSESQAEQRADQIMKAASGSFGSVECKCIGLPEIVPGKRVSFKGFSTEADCTVYITSVRHIVDGSGYSTTLEARFDTL